MLITRVANADITWHKNLNVHTPRVSQHFDLTLDEKAVIRAIDQLNFIQMKRKYQRIDSYCRITKLTNVKIYNKKKKKTMKLNTTLKNRRFFPNESLPDFANQIKEI